MHDDQLARARLALLPPQGSRHLMAIDLPKFVRRAWHGHVNDRRHEPERVAPTTLKQIARILRGQQPSRVIAADDGPELYRAKLHPGYKAGRPPKPEELADAEHTVRDALLGADVYPWRVKGLEADDVLHAAALHGRRFALPVVVVADDKDALQLVDDAARVVVWDGDAAVMDAASVRAKWGVEPTRLVDLLSLAGDSTDGIPGVHGWGPKTAAQILQAAAPNDLPSLLKDGGHWWVPEKWRAKFIENRKVIRLSYDLARLRGQWLADRAEFGANDVNALMVADLLLDAAERLSP